jgi:nicotinamidase-related amidase
MATPYVKEKLGGVVLVIIDPQNDFHPGGSLAIPTADEDSARTAKFITEKALAIDEIVVTLDSHQRFHIAHGLFWTDSSNKHPPPFTIITAADIEAGKWRSCVPEYQEIGLTYARKLEEAGRFKICIWPEHCIIGTTGHNVRPSVMEALNYWAEVNKKEIRWVFKGQNIFTEMYSALKAEVPLQDSRTRRNVELIDFIKKHDRILVCGQALSHCVNFTTRDLVESFRAHHDKVIVMTDGSSPVPGFEKEGQTFLNDMRALGVQTKTMPEVAATVL